MESPHCTAINLCKEFGETTIEGQGVLDAPSWHGQDADCVSQKRRQPQMQLAAQNVAQTLANDGYVVIPNVLSSPEVHQVAHTIGGTLCDKAGTRRMLDLPWCARLGAKVADEPRLREILPTSLRPVQCTLFAKTADSNWLVSMHQDLSIPVAERIESLACSGWSQKQDGIFVQPPISVLESVFAVRLHLDEGHQRNGALRVVPGSHLLGRLTSDKASRARATLVESG
jgi:hypothetical protein